MKPHIRYSWGIGLILAAVGLFALAEHLADVQGFFILPLYGLSLFILICGILMLANKLHKIVPEDWPYN